MSEDAGLHHLRSGEGPPLLLIHSLGLTSRQWLPVIPPLAEVHEVIAIDLPGLGRSARLPLGLAPSIPNLADAVERHLDRLGLGGTHVAGTSLGGWLALELGRRARAKTVTAIAPLGLGTSRENRRTHRRLRMALAAAALARPVAGAMAKTALGRILANGLIMARPRQADATETASMIRAFARGASVIEEALQWGLAHHPSHLEQLSCPVTLAWGTRDLILPWRQAARFAARIPNAELVMLQGLGHVPISDDPKLVASLILGQSKGKAARSMLALGGQVGS